MSPRLIALSRRHGLRDLRSPAGSLQLCLCHGMLALQAGKQMLFATSAVGRLALNLCCACCLPQRLGPFHGAIEGPNHVC